MRRKRRRHQRTTPVPEGDLIAGSIPLTSLRPGDAGRVVSVLGEGPFRRRLLDMGFVRGTFVMVIKHAPLMNPIEYCVGGVHLTLRKDEAMRVVVDQVPAPERCESRMRHARGHRFQRGRGKGPRWWRRVR
jgi:ferrous iron transport protein A